MKTLYGNEAVNGDYVLIQDVAYMSGTATILPAKVVGDKAYAAYAVPCRNLCYRWIRKEVAIITIDESFVTDAQKQLIELNIAADKSTFERTSDSARQVWELLNMIAQESRN